MRFRNRFILVACVVLLEIAAYFVASGLILSAYTLYPLTVLLIVVFILSLNILWLPAMPTATAIAEVFTRRGKGAIFRWTKDSLAIVVTATFLTWVVVSAFLPVWYYPAASVLWGPRGAYTVPLDLIAAITCFFLYLPLADNLPERATVRAK
jgi:hypothetical protein